MKKIIVVFILASSLNACTWVKPSPKSQEVVLKSQAQIVNCVKKGETHAKSLAKIAFVARNEEKVFTELVLLAKNEAVILKGDTVVADGKMVNGEQNFSVYQCN